MRRYRRRAFGATAVAGAVSVLLIGLSAPAFADDPSPSGPSDPGSTAPPAPAGPEQTAQWQAVQTGRPVVVDALTTEVSQTTAEPDGSFSVSSSILPVRVRKSGSWTGVDATLAANSDGTYSPTATPSAVTLSGGGTGPLATLTDAAGRMLSYTFPFTLPAPSVSGDSALYADVLPGVDLKASVTDQGGFSEVLIVHDATAAANPALKKLTLSTSTQGLTLASDTAGNISATTGDGNTVFSSPTPLMWDSSTQISAQPTATGATRTASAADTSADSADISSPDGPGAGAQVQSVGVTTAPGSVTLSPDTSLLTGADTTYPVYIDPYTSPHPLQVSHYTQVFENSGCRTPQWDTPQSNGGEGVGYQHFDYSSSGCPGLERTFYQFDTSYLIPQMHINDAELTLSETRGADGGCTNTWPLTVEETGAIGKTTVWPGPDGTAIRTDHLKSASACGGQDATFTVTGQLRTLATTTPNDTWTIGLFGDENKYDTNYGFMRFSINPTIVVDFDIPPNTPSAPATVPDSLAKDGSSAGAACNEATPGWIGRTTLVGGDSNITLSATVTSPMNGANLHGVFTVWDNQTPASNGGATTYPSVNSSSVASGETVRANVGIAVKDGHQYGWSVFANDGQLSGPALSGCHFNVDLNPPKTTIVSDSAAFPPLGSGKTPTGYAGQSGLTLQVRGQDTAPSGCAPNACLASGVQRFEYSMDTPIPPNGGKSVTATAGSNGTATANIPISVTAQQWGTHTLYVQAVDAADNARPITYSFYAPWDPTGESHVNPGDLTGDGIPDAITPASNGTLQLIPGDSDMSAKPKTVSMSDNAPDCPTENTNCHPDRPGWSNFLVTHRGSYANMGIDDLVAFSRNNDQMYLYENDAITAGGGQPGNFTQSQNVSTLTAKPGCMTAADGTGCAGYDGSSWASLTQMLAIGNPAVFDGPSDIVTVENGHLWFYAGSKRADSFLQSARLLGNGDWSGTTLIAPGTMGSNLTLWVRDNVSGLISSYPIPVDADGLPTTQLTPPGGHPLTSGVHTTDGSPLCADIEKNNTGNGTPIQTYTCNGTIAQSWTLGTDNSVRALGKCLDVTSAGTSPGTPIQLYTCNGTPAQKWVPGAHGTLTNPSSGLCLTDPGAVTAGGTQLVLQTCATAGAPEQSWTTDTSGTAPVQEVLLPVNFTTFQYPTLLSPGDANAPSNAGTGAPDGNPDLYAINRAGKVIEYPGTAATNGIPQFSTPVPIGYTSAPPVVPDAPGDLNGDGTPDLVATDTNGHLRFYANSGNGKPAGAGIDLGGGWAGAIVSHRGDWNGDGYEDLIVHLPSDPVDLWLYPGNGTGGFGTRQVIERPPGPGTIVYATWDVPHIISAGDITGDGRPDLLVVEDDQLLLFPGLGNGQVGSPTVIGTAGWSRMDIMAPGDVNGDGLNDLWARNTSNGDVVQYLNDPTSPTPGASLGLGSRAVTIATGFTTTGVKSVAASGDGNGDGQPDLWATWTSDDHLYFYTGTGKNSPGFSGHTDVSGAGWTTTINDIS